MYIVYARGHQMAAGEWIISGPQTKRKKNEYLKHNFGVLFLNVFSFYRRQKTKLLQCGAYISYWTIIMCYDVII